MASDFGDSVSLWGVPAFAGLGARAVLRLGELTHRTRLSEMVLVR